MIHLYEPMTDYLEMQCKQLCVIAVTDIPIFKSRSHPPKTQIGSSSQIIMVAPWHWTATLTIEPVGVLNVQRE